MTSPSPRKRRTIVWSRRLVAAVVLVVAACSATGACRKTPRDPLVTYFNPEARLTIRHPASWRSEEAQQEGVWYRYFLAPPIENQRKSAVSATLLVGPLHGPLEQYAQTYLDENVQTRLVDAERPGLRGKHWSFASPDGAVRHSLLLLTDVQPRPEPRVIGLYCQGDAEAFAEHASLLDEMAESVRLDRVEDYVEYRDDENRVSVRVPPSWNRDRRVRRGETQLVQYSSPALGADKSGLTARATLTIGVEPAPQGLEAFYDATRGRLGEAFVLLDHEAWHGGYADVMAVETGMAASRIKRYYRVANGKGYSLAFEARDDIYLRASPWFDIIAETLRVGSEITPAAPERK